MIRMSYNKVCIMNNSKEKDFCKLAGKVAPFISAEILLRKCLHRMRIHALLLLQYKISQFDLLFWSRKFLGDDEALQKSKR